MRAALFDLDGTLVDSAALWRRALASLVMGRQGRPEADAVEGLCGLTAVDAVATIGRRLRWPVGAVARDAHWVERQVCAGYSERVTWQAGALALVQSIRAAGVMIGLVTSSSRTVVEAVLADRQCPGFDIVVSGDDVRAVKPAPDPYILAAKLLAVSTFQCVAFEDSAIGIASAVAAGCAVVAVGKEASCPGTGQCLRVDSLTDIVPAEILRSPKGRVAVGEDHD